MDQVFMVSFSGVCSLYIADGINDGRHAQGVEIFVIVEGGRNHNLAVGFIPGTRLGVLIDDAWLQ